MNIRQARKIVCARLCGDLRHDKGRRVRAALKCVDYQFRRDPCAWYIHRKSPFYRPLKELKENHNA